MDTICYITQFPLKVNSARALLSYVRQNINLWGGGRAFRVIMPRIEVELKKKQAAGTSSTQTSACSEIMQHATVRHKEIMSRWKSFTLKD